MATYYVRKNGSGTHTTIQSAFLQATTGDIIDVGAGVFEENVDFYKNGITLQGAGKTQTEVKGVLESNVTKSCTFTSGSTTINVPAGTSGLIVGRHIQGTGIAVGSRIVSISANSFVISVATTSARTNESLVMALVPAAIVVRGSNHTVKGMKITGVQALSSRCLADNAAIFFRTANTLAGSTAAIGYILEDCIIEARGESAIMTDAAGSVGNGIIRNNIIQGKTFVGSEAAQVPFFGTMTKTGTVLTRRTIRFSEVSGITGPHAGNAQGSEITPGLRVASVSGLVVTTTLDIPVSFVTGQSYNFSFANVQFNFPNVPRQLVVIQGVNLSSQFLNNTVNGVTGSGICYNTAVTMDTPSAVVTGNTIDGEFKYGYALRARGAGSTVANNLNRAPGNRANAGFLIGPNGPTQVFGSNIGTNTTKSTLMVNPSQESSGLPVKNTIEKSDIKAFSKVATDSVFSNEANWELVVCVYKHKDSSKRLISAFRDFSAQKEMKLKSNMASGEQYQLHKIIITKSDKSMLVIKRSEISDASSYDFILK
jgi:hypothetical protein